MFDNFDKLKYKKFEPRDRIDLLELRIKYLKKYVDEAKETVLAKHPESKKDKAKLNKEIEIILKEKEEKEEIKFPNNPNHVLEILEKIRELLNEDPDLEDSALYEKILPPSDKDGLVDPQDVKDTMYYVKMYAKDEQFKVLPDIMEYDYDDIPDEDGMTKDELVELIQRFGEGINNITNKERDLNSKLDCSIYAEQYLDYLEQIASLYKTRVIPRRAADYFANKFAYGINLLDWYNDKILTSDKSDPFDPTKQLFDDVRGKENDRWIEFKWFCRGAGNPDNAITKFTRDEGDRQEYVLPDSMYEYDWLPDEEGMNPNEVLEIMRNYAKQLTELSGKETQLKTKIGCSVYAEQYLDTLEQIAYLFNKKALATDAPTYFENNFSYGKTLKKWYTEFVNGAEEQEDRWTEFDYYCENFEDENDEPKKIEAFDMESVLPKSMLAYEQLPVDEAGIEYS